MYIYVHILTYMLQTRGINQRNGSIGDGYVNQGERGRERN